MSFDGFGFLERMIINRQTRRLISGHGRLDTLMHLKASGAPLPVGIDESDGEWLVPVDYVDLPKDEEMAAAIALNRTTELGGWNDAALARVLSDLAAKDALMGIGYDRDDVNELARRIGSENRTIPRTMTACWSSRLRSSAGNSRPRRTRSGKRARSGFTAVTAARFPARFSMAIGSVSSGPTRRTALATPKRMNFSTRETAATASKKKLPAII